MTGREFAANWVTKIPYAIHQIGIALECSPFGTVASRLKKLRIPILDEGVFRLPLTDRSVDEGKMRLELIGRIF